MSTEIRASVASPANFIESGVSKGKYSSTTSSAEIEFDTPGTYHVWLNLYENGELKTYSITSIVIEKVKPDPPLPWEWNGTETAAFTEQGPVGALTMARWNAFLDKINEAIAYCNDYYETTLAEVLDTEKMQANKTMLAMSFTAVCTKLNALCDYRGEDGCGITNVSKGDIIYGSYFIDLKDALNRAIGAL